MGKNEIEKEKRYKRKKREVGSMKKDKKLQR